MTSDLIELEEQKEKCVPLTQAEARELRELGLDVYLYPNDTTHYCVDPKSWVGHFRLSSEGSRVVYIKPKVGIRNLFALLGASYQWYRDQSPFRKPPVDYDIDVAEVIEPLVEMFNEQVRKILQDGLLKKYVQMQENCSVVKCRIVFSEQIRRNLVHKERIFCRFAQCETDIPENQVILFTLLLLRQIRDLSPQVRRDLTSNILHFGDVSIRQFLPTQMPLFTYDRLSQRYEEVHSWCRLFIDMMSLSEKPGERIFNGFLLDMNVLFERFVISMFQRASRHVFGISVTPYKQRALTMDNQVHINPDLLLGVRENDLKIPLDAKYKITKGTEKAKHPDLYQLIAYCSALGMIGEKQLPFQGILVYPVSDESERTGELPPELDIITKKGPQSELKVIVHYLDLKSKRVVKETEERFKNILESLK